MGREIRMVPPHWEHPQEEKYNYRTGEHEMRYKPMFDTPYIEALNEWLKYHQEWEAHTHDSWEEYHEEYPHYALFGGDPPSVQHYRPDWKEEPTWFQVYETVSEGTPVTPPFATREELVDYLAANGDFWDQNRRKECRSIMPCESWPRETAEKFVFGDGWAPSFISVGGTIKSGVDALYGPQP